MVLDLIVLALLGIFILAGYRNGAFAQILQSVLLVTSFLVAYIGRAPVGHLLGRFTGISAWYAGFAILLVLWLACLVAAEQIYRADSILGSLPMWSCESSPRR